MLRVLHCVSKMDRGGIETLLMNIYRNIDRNQIQFDFLVTNNNQGEYDEEILNLGGKIYNISARREGYFKHKHQLYDFFKKTNYDIVQLHISSLSNIQVLKAAKYSNVGVRIVHSHNTKGPKGVFHEIMHRYNRLIIDKYCTDKFACSKEAAVWAYGRKKDVIIFKNAIDTKKFLFNNKTRKKIRKELNLKDSFVVGHVGRFVEQKNHNFIIDVFKEFKQLKSNSILLLIGVGRLEKQIKEKVKLKGLEDSVIFLGSQSDVNNLMQAMDTFIFPSLYEGLGIVAVEAQSTGLPVLASSFVPKEAAITDLFYSMKLKSNEKIWAKKLYRISNEIERASKRDEVINKGYDITSNSEWLTNFYFQKKMDLM